MIIHARVSPEAHYFAADRAVGCPGTGARMPTGRSDANTCDPGADELSCSAAGCGSHPQAQCEAADRAKDEFGEDETPPRAGTRSTVHVDRRQSPHIHRNRT
jgi:hypothetical protein